MDNVRDRSPKAPNRPSNARSALPALDEYRSIKDQLHGRLCSEVSELEFRIQVLNASGSCHSKTIIRTYERMIEQKRRFMQHWGMNSTG